MRGTSVLPAGNRRLRAELGIGDHLLYGLNTRNWLFREGKTEGDGSEQLTIDIDRTTTHSLHDPGLFEGTTGELGENNRLLWREVFEDTEDLDLELFDPISVENGTPDPVLAGPDVFELEKSLSETHPRRDKE